ncbi:Transcriptional regulatory protein WalR [Paenibacillus solanacearum]|uniref:Transcriptional regulatory protein WalR n=1 Tax=Paenibacillus solanacearum TaxID=2048548 RepID=A0A916KA49_9BACL|nr:response regulator transcription factor [Paenibacillus solanacearum]CAG7650349.1 Transcriptional regulatory protein WalR [Paenibacillus solanacearum]
MTGQKILVAEDDPEIREVIRLYLQKNDYEVVLADNGDDAVRLARTELPDLAILDVLLPGKDGFDVCKDIRAMSSAPILFLSCRKDESDKITGLNMGGDDYITKPFSPNELMARVRANLRRPHMAGGDSDAQNLKLTAGAVQIDRLSRVVRLNGQEVALSRKEFDLLCYLASRPDQTFTHEQLFKEIWGQECFNDTRTIIVHVSNLRKKIEPDPSNPVYIINVHGVGYKFAKISPQ